MYQIIFGGDAMFGRLFNEKLDKMEVNDYKNIFGNLLQKLNESDLVIVNLETILQILKKKINTQIKFLIINYQVDLAIF